MLYLLECDNASLRREHRNFTAIAFKSLANHFANHNTIRRRKIAARNEEQRTRGGATSPPSFKVSMYSDYSIVSALGITGFYKIILKNSMYIFLEFRLIQVLLNQLQILLETDIVFYVKTLPRFDQVAKT